MTVMRPADFGIGLLFELIRDAVVVADVVTERICLWNAAAEEMFGYSAAEAVGLPLEALVPQELRGAHHAGIAAFRDTSRGALTDSGAVVTVPAIRNDGSRIAVDLRLTPLTAIKGTFVLAMLRDVTERQALMTDLEAANANLELALKTEQEVSASLAQLIELKDDFVAMLSHDLASPLTSVRGNASLLRRSFDRLDPEQRDRTLESIERATDRMTALVRDLLDAARLDAGVVPYELAPLDIVESLRQVIREVDPGGERITLDAPPNGCSVTCDSARHSQIATNLLSNALKFSPAESRITVTVRTTDTDVVVAVTDRGPGIAEDERPQVFERFHRLSSTAVAPGTGLGLYITRRLVEDQGGRIEMVPVTEGGSTFRYSLPK